MPVNTALWFIVSGLLATATALAIVFGWYVALPHLCATAGLAVSTVVSFIVGSMAWPTSHESFSYSSYEDEFADWQNAGQTLNTALLFMLAGVFLAGAVAGIGFSALTITGLCLFGSVVSCIAAYGVWGCTV
jgi:hypothetical protein